MSEKIKYIGLLLFILLVLWAYGGDSSDRLKARTFYSVVVLVVIAALILFIKFVMRFLQKKK